jgi:hypothetical protein
MDGFDRFDLASAVFDVPLALQEGTAVGSAVVPQSAGCEVDGRLAVVLTGRARDRHEVVAAEVLLGQDRVIAAGRHDPMLNCSSRI